MWHFLQREYLTKVQLLLGWKSAFPPTSSFKKNKTREKVLFFRKTILETPLSKKSLKARDQ